MAPRPDVSKERRKQITDAALACFSRKGYTNTTMDDIVAESGLSKGTLYWYFKGKDELFTSMVEAAFESLSLEAMAELAHHETVAEKLVAGTRYMVTFCERCKGLFGLFVEFWLQSENRDEVGRYWADVLARYTGMIAGLVDEGAESGEFRPVDAEQLMWAVMATYDGLAAYAMFVPDLDLQRISDVLVDTLLHGLLVDTGLGTTTTDGHR